jgi:glycine/D-amino acid oxidase-like deaminating enzyme
MSAQRVDIAVIGGGLVGAAIAFGLRAPGLKLALLDEGDVAFRASRGNFGLIWVQGKGFGSPAYGGWTRTSARAWPRLAAMLRETTGVDVALRQLGGLHVCLSADELAARADRMAALLAQPGFERYDIDVLDRAGVAARMPAVGPGVVGGTWSALDGDCNPLRLLRALHVALERAGAVHHAGFPIERIEPGADGFTLHSTRGKLVCDRVVLAAGLGNARLAPMVGLAAPVTPNKGHIIVLERVQRFLDVPLETIRQTDEGTVMIGDSQQALGFDDTLDPAVLAAMAERAVRVFPLLRGVRVNRTWAALRVMSPDGFPIYAQSAANPGAFLATCHSGVTLAAAHAFELAPAIANGRLPALFDPFSNRRFDVRAAA